MSTHESTAVTVSRLMQENFSVAPAHSLFLAGFVGKDLEAILSEARVQHFFRHTVITTQDAAADRLFLITKGRARFFFETPEGKKLILLWLVPGDIFGGAALVEPCVNYLVGTEALKDSSMLVWDRATLRKLIVRYPTLVQNALRFAHTYLAWYVADHSALVTHSARQRLARVIVCLAEGIGEEIGDHREIDATNEELATAANITPFTTSRILREWQRRRAVVKRRGKIVLLSKKLLFATANDREGRHERSLM